MICLREDKAVPDPIWKPMWPQPAPDSAQSPRDWPCIPVAGRESWGLQHEWSYKAEHDLLWFSPSHLPPSKPETDLCRAQPLNTAMWQLKIHILYCLLSPRAKAIMTLQSSLFSRFLLFCLLTSRHAWFAPTQRWKAASSLNGNSTRCFGGCRTSTATGGRESKKASPQLVAHKHPLSAPEQQINTDSPFHTCKQQLIRPSKCSKQIHNTYLVVNTLRQRYTG